jgi:diguanylate cyclase (GGDEF)-like protein/PAS domain S-box-containing protein
LNALPERRPPVDDEHTQRSRRMSTDEELRLRAELLRAQADLQLWSSVFEHSAEGVMICDSHQRIQNVNAAFESVTGYSKPEVVGRMPSILHSGRQDGAFYADLWRSVDSTGCWTGELQNRRKSGEFYAERLTIRAVYDQSRTVTHYIGIFSDLTERKAAEDHARHIAEFDLLTELPNRTLLVRRLQQLMQVAGKSGEKIAVLFLNLDRFGEVNQTMGHDAGDRLLQTVARRITGAIRHSDFVARKGADEFLVLTPALHETSDAAAIAGSILDAIRAPISLNGQDLTISASVGIAISPQDGTAPEELIQNAAAAMQQVKREQCSAYQFYNRDSNDRVAKRLRTEGALRLALERHELVLHYQPQIDLRTARIVGAEALVRWNRPGEGLVAPSEFIPIAEESGLILAVGDWVLAEALRQIRAWDTQRLAPITVAINISARQFRQPDFAEHIAHELQLNDIAPCRLGLELTESIAVRDVELATQILQRLHRIGVQLSLDDFGTGYCSLNYLRNFPIDRIKIDQSFIRELTDQPQSIRVVRGIIALAKSFAMRVIAEGVETPQQLALLRAEKCDAYQGYLVSAAVPADQFAGLLRTWKAVA